MSSLARRILVVSLVVVLLAQAVPVLVSNTGPDTESRETGSASRNQQTPESTPRVEQGGPPIAVSLNGGVPVPLPEFLGKEADKVQAPSHSYGFVIASESDPNITHIYWQNYTGDVSGNWVTWMQPGGKVRIWFEVKGPISASGPSMTVWFGEVKSMSTEYGTYLDVGDLNGFGNLGVNETWWFYWDQVLPIGSGYYGWGSGLVNAFTLRLYHAILYPWVTPYYEGLYDKYNYLNMYGEIRVRSVAWYNSTGPAEIRVAQKGWKVSPLFAVSIDNAPVWGASFETEWRGDVVWWPDTHINWSAVNTVSGKMFPGNYSVYPRTSPSSSSWLFCQIDPSAAYGSGIGQTRGVYCKLFVSSVEIYSSNNEGALLYVVDKISNQAPQINVIAPLDGEVFTESLLTLDAFVTDPNSNYDINTLLLFVDGVSSNVKPNYNIVQGRLATAVGLPQSGSVVNLTVSAQDRGGLRSSATVLILSDNPPAYFPAGYVTSSQHYSLAFLNHQFAWEGRLSFEPGPDVNFTLTPKASFNVACSVAFDMYTGTPQSVHSGENYTTYVMVSNPRLTLSIDFAVKMDYYLRILTGVLSGTATLFQKHWDASMGLLLGVDVLDLRYDIPGVSQYISKFTHYEISLLDAIPIISDFASVRLSVDIVPLLKVSNVLSADIVGSGCTTLLSKINLVSERSFAILASVPSSASGSSCSVQSVEHSHDCESRVRCLRQPLAFWCGPNLYTDGGQPERVAVRPPRDRNTLSEHLASKVKHSSRRVHLDSYAD